MEKDDRSLYELGYVETHHIGEESAYVYRMKDERGIRGIAVDKETLFSVGFEEYEDGRQMDMYGFTRDELLAVGELVRSVRKGV